jgi:hypothetical protein
MTKALQASLSVSLKVTYNWVCEEWNRGEATQTPPSTLLPKSKPVPCLWELEYQEYPPRISQHH